MIHDLKKIVIETTHRCQAKCPDCSRTRFIKDGFSFDDKLDLPKEVIDNIADSNLGKQLKHVLLNGNFGDALSYPHHLYLIERFRDSNIKVRLYTNGSMFTPDYFRKLASYENLEIVFAIDGLQDTHSIYRINTKFQKVIDNAKAYIDGGGYAICATILFPWIEHQIDDIKALVDEMGFHRFWISNPRGGKKKHNESVKLIATDRDTEYKGLCRGSYQCASVEKKRMAIDAYGNLWPCGFMSTERVDGVTNSYDFFKFETNLAKESIDTVYSNYMDVSDHFFTAMEADQIPICSGTCFNPNMADDVIR